MMKRILPLLFLFSTCELRADMVVIGNINNDLMEMTQKQVVDVFMGRTRLLPNGSFALPIDEPQARSAFYKALTDRPIEQIDAYWARIIFSGQATPPMKLPDAQAVLKVVMENKGAIGYIDSELITGTGTRTLLTLE